MHPSLQSIGDLPQLRAFSLCPDCMRTVFQGAFEVEISKPMQQAALLLQSQCGPSCEEEDA